MERMREAGMNARLSTRWGTWLAGSPGGVRRRAGSFSAPTSTRCETPGSTTARSGCCSPIACLKALDERDERLEYPVDVIAFGDEEGSSASRRPSSAAGPSPETSIPSSSPPWTRTGCGLREALREFGLDPEAVAEAEYHRDDVAGYVEVHIEQGPVLEAEDRPGRGW